MIEPGIPLVFNDRAYRLRALLLEVKTGGLPRWVVDVDGSKGAGDSLEHAILYAARGADSCRTAEERKP